MSGIADRKLYDDERYNELAYYTLAHGDARFIHQHVVDAFAAQNADENTKPMATVFALVGLYLYLEKDFTGRQVQQMHMRLGDRSRQWPRLPVPAGNRGEVTISTVLAVPPGSGRDQMIRTWCESVWGTWADSRPQIVVLLKLELGID